ncbi:MAG: SpvB/TcaC N-terminal domain-containing protein, partial [Nitrospirota bacterium]
MTIKHHDLSLIRLAVFILPLLLAWGNIYAQEGGDGGGGHSGGAQALSLVGGSAGSGGGSGGGTVTPDLFTGTLSHAIPIEVPPGRNGVQPQLALTYRSNNGNGVIGVGWELEVGAVERSIKFGLDYNGDDYVLRMAGSSVDLVRTSGTAPDDGEFRPKIEGSFHRIKKIGSSWEVTDKAGKRYLFGQTADSRQDGPPGVFRWSLDQVIDPDGNEMRFTYLPKAQGQLYLDRIDYTYPGPLQYVKLYWESRPDTSVMYTTNFKVVTAYRLKTIEVAAAGVPQRIYTLAYTISGSTGRSLIAGVQQYDKNASVDPATGAVTGGSTLPATTFLWYDAASILNTVLNISDWYGLTQSQWATTTHRIIAGDFNGDGKTDLLLQADSIDAGTFLLLADGAGGFQAAQNISNSYGL